MKCLHDICLHEAQGKSKFCSRSCYHKHRYLHRDDKERQRRAEYDREYTRTHRDQINARNRQRYDSDESYRQRILSYPRNKEAAIERSRQWALDNPKRVRELSRMTECNRRARKLNQSIENVNPQTVYEMHGGMCGICKEFIDGDFHVDHIIPLSKGGMHGYTNVQPAHPTCNLRKGNRI